jgi:NADH-quinone oxidoreductase subunit J
MFPTYQVIFYFFAAMLVLASFAVILARNPVASIMSLVLAFFCSSVLWMMLRAEFLSLVLIFVYVGAVMTLFLFVVMMINFQGIFYQRKFVHYLPFALFMFVILLALISLALLHSHMPFMHAALPAAKPGLDNTRALGILLYTDYVYPFEIAGAILLVAIVAAITLACHGRRPGTKAQNIAQQHAVTKAQRLNILKMKGESK